MMNAVVVDGAQSARRRCGDDADSKPSDERSARWHYVVPAPGDPFDHAPFRALVLEPRQAGRADRKGRVSRRARAGGDMRGSGSAAPARRG